MREIFRRPGSLVWILVLEPDRRGKNAPMSLGVMGWVGESWGRRPSGPDGLRRGHGGSAAK